jgi:DNA-binding beta-propeller fold protein YncE
MFARRSDLTGLGPIGPLTLAQSRFVCRMVIGWLHVIQPLARMTGRMRGLWSMPDGAPLAPVMRLHWKASLPSLRDIQTSGRVLAGLACRRMFWSDSWVAHTTVLTELEAVLRAVRPAASVEPDDGWHADRDLDVAVGRWAWLHVRVLVEEHSEGRCLLRTAACLRPTYAGAVQGLALTLALATAAAAGATMGWSWLSVMTIAGAAGVVARCMWQATRVTAVFDTALTRVTADANMLPLPIHSPAREPRGARVQPATAMRAAWAALVVILAVLATFAASMRAVRVISDAEASGGVAVGIAGDVFVADAQQGVIRRLRPRPPFNASWSAHDIGTDGYPLLGHTVPFDAPSDIAVAPNGDVYVADARHHRISRVVRSTGAIMTIAGSGTAGFAGDGGPAISASLHGPSAVAVAPNGDIYIADTLNDRIRVVSSATGLIATFAGDGQAAAPERVGDDGPALRAQLNRPSGLSLAPDGDLYVADTGHNRVRRISRATGVITTIAGDGRTGSSGDGGPALHASLSAPMGLALAPASGRLVVYVADRLNNRIRVIEPGGEIATLEGSARVLAPTRVAYHPAGWLYVKDASPDGVTALAASKSLLQAAATVTHPSSRKGT